jgi:hypothetical protein
MLAKGDMSLSRIDAMCRMWHPTHTARGLNAASHISGDDAAESRSRHPTPPMNQRRNRLSLTLPLALILVAPLPLLAATYKCAVNGGTVYQQAPCAADAQSEVLKLPSGNSGNGATYSANDVAKLRLEVQANGDRMARDAFEQLVSGRADVYVANLCPRERKLWSNPTMKGSIRSMGATLVSDKWRLGRQTEASMDSLTYAALQDPSVVMPKAGTPVRVRTVRAHFGRDLGKLCLRVLDIGA